MKKISFVVVLCFSTSLLATTWNCPILSEDNNPTRPIERLEVEFNRSFDEVTYIHQVPNSEGTFSEKPETLFSKTKRIRGGVPFAYCSTDDGRVSMEYNRLNWYSECATSGNEWPLVFEANFHLNKPGFVQIQIIDLQGDEDINRVIRITACK